MVPITRLPAYPLDMCRPARRSRHTKDFLNPKFFDLLRKIRTEDAVSIS
ncbi:MAG TPA: hypothetical protein VKB88_00605 [Bryobacteraceae bacterium]|nr:hypothetical protein [Bryobacteraceae bacterium]